MLLKRQPFIWLLAGYLKVTRKNVISVLLHYIPFDRNLGTYARYCFWFQFSLFWYIQCHKTT